MKIQCSCGAKYSLDITPEMAQAPVRFVCQACGLDASDFVTDMVRRELASAAFSSPAAPVPAVAAAPAPAPPPDPAPAVAAPAAPPEAAPAKPRLSIARATATAAQPTRPETDAAEFCVKHQQHVVGNCMMCNKPICPKCMELFGYVCSPLCKARADSHGIEIPVFEGQKSVIEARLWSKAVRISAAVGGVIVVILGLWFWYAWFGSVPKPVFSVRFPDIVHSGESAFCGKDQLVFLRGGMLARYDTRTKKEVWSSYLVDKKKVEASVDQQMKSYQKVIDKAAAEAWDEIPRMPARDKMLAAMLEMRAAALQLRVHGSNVWVSDSEKLVHYDWDTGKAVKEVPLAAYGELISMGDQLLVPGETESGQETITHIDLATGESKVEEIGPPPKPKPVMVAKADPKKPASAGRAGGAGAGGGRGLPITPGAGGDKPLDPKKVEEDAQRLSLPGKLALPAVLANTLNQERIEAELKDPTRRRLGSDVEDTEEHFSLIPGRNGHVQYSVRLLESKWVSHKAMKDAPAKSALDGEVNKSKTGDIANEILNEIQRSHGGDTIEVDESRYLVTIRRPDAKDAPEWRGEVIGPPGVFSLATVNVLTANKSITVLDKTNKKLWQAALSFNVKGGGGDMDEEELPRFGAGPCVEHGDTLYVADEAVLTAFDLKTGNVRWRLPSVGLVGMFFDDKGMLYVNTTTASPETVKFVRQIDITRKSSEIVLKVDPATGKMLWGASAGGYVTHVEGKFLFTVQSYDSGDEDYEPNDLTVLSPRKPYLRIRRLSPSDGHVVWEHFQTRAPLDVKFRENYIQLVFKKEVQVLRFLTF